MTPPRPPRRIQAPRLGVVIAAWLLVPLAAFADSAMPAGPDAGVRERAIPTGETLTYDVSWLSIPAGSAVMEVHAAPPVENRPARLLVTTARSNAFVSAFYPVDNRVESRVDAEQWWPRHTSFHRREGRRRNDYEVTFDRSLGTALSVKDGAAQTVEVPADVHDLLSCLYYVRSVPVLQPGTSVFLTVHHDRKNYRLEVRVEAIEPVSGPWGEVPAIRVLAIMPFQGIFLNEGNIRVWLTHDVRRVPVMMKAKVVIGSVVARLRDGGWPVATPAGSWR